MASKLRCPCEGKYPGCKLCLGGGFYPYEPGPRGWMPFVCPTCNGSGYMETASEASQECPTCHKTGNIDPANPPVTMMNRIRKIFFGG
jgi:DnaJ-class molecular chaperone